MKAKRAELNRVKAHPARSACGASVAEVAHQDSWQRSTLAVALAGGSAGRCEEAADACERALDARFPQGVRVERTSGLVGRPGSARVTADRMRRVDEAVREVLSDAITTASSRIPALDSSP